MASLICTYVVATAKVRLLHVDRLKREIKMPYMHDMHMLSMIKFSRVLRTESAIALLMSSECEVHHGVGAKPS